MLFTSNGENCKESIHTVEKKKMSWTTLELGKYFNVCFAQEFVLAALVVTVVTECIGIFLGFDFQEGVPQVEPFALQNKSQALPKRHKHTPFFGRLDTATCCRQTDVSSEASDIVLGSAGPLGLIHYSC